jgi:cysteinyl-tRNA synthetase
LLQDINTNDAIARLHDLTKEYHKTSDIKSKSKLANIIYNSGRLLGLFFDLPNEIGSLPEETAKMVEERQKARQNKNWQLADELRDKLLHKGIKIEDKPDGSYKWSRL